jgi:catechol 2,3-dioxygenase-like lactoylglutathione lyase family enzyme
LDCTLIVVRVFVRDWAAGVRFYNETLGIPLAFKDEAMGWAQLSTGQAQLAIERFQDDAAGELDGDAALVGRFLGVSLAVDDIYGVYDELRAKGVAFEEPPERMPWGGVLAHFRDPEGNVLTLVGEPRKQ